MQSNQSKLQPLSKTDEWNLIPPDGVLSLLIEKQKGWKKALGY